MGRIALVGGDEFRPDCEPMDSTILAATNIKSPRVLIIPTAASPQNPSKAASNGVSYFTKLGADASPLMVLEPSDANDPTILEPVKYADLIYLTGGDPSYLVDTFAESIMTHLLLDLLDRGGTVVGSSAGAMVLGSWMNHRGWKKSLGVVTGVTVLPHHEHSNHTMVITQLSKTPPENRTVLGIDGMTCFFGSNDEGTVLGKGAVTVYSRGQYQRYESGETISLVH